MQHAVGVEGETLWEGQREKVFENVYAPEHHC